MDRNHTALRASCDQVRDSLAAYSLDAVDQPERAQVEAHLERCAECRRELSEYAEVAAMLGRHAPAATVPGAMRDRLLDEVGAGHAVYGELILSSSRDQRAVPAPSPSKGRLPLRIGRPSLAAVAAVVALASMGWAFALQLELRAQDAAVARLAQRSERYDRVVAVLRSEYLQVRDLRGTDEAPAAAGRIMIDPANESGMLIVHNLPPVPADRAYQVWFVGESGRQSGGLVRPDEHGRGYFFIHVPQDLATFQTIGITEEPSVGSDGPTGRRVLGGEL